LRTPKKQWHSPRLEPLALISTVDPIAFLQGHVPAGVRLISSTELSPQSLDLALKGCGVSNTNLINTVTRLRDAVRSFQSSLDTGELELPYDANTAFRMLRIKEAVRRDEGRRLKEIVRVRLEEERPKPTPAARKRAHRLHKSALGPNRLNVTPKGKPSEIDSTLVVYCMRLLCEAKGKKQFQFSRYYGCRLGGPMWRALIEMLAFAVANSRRTAFAFGVSQVFGGPITLDELSKGIDEITKAAKDGLSKHSETIAEIVTAVRSKRFKAACRNLGLGPTADDVLAHPATFRSAVSWARR
jgi:hypothetical protein